MQGGIHITKCSTPYSLWRCAMYIVFDDDKMMPPILFLQSAAKSHRNQLQKKNYRLTLASENYFEHCVGIRIACAFTQLPECHYRSLDFSLLVLKVKPFPKPAGKSDKDALVRSKLNVEIVQGSQGMVFIQLPSQPYFVIQKWYQRSLFILLRVLGQFFRVFNLCK